mmetsp:Transcript_50833/g.118061  ORF Transcript_50833/g.118061 Transcript_50833/m.118061 type:complete len:362 (-) Transcript_50833:48-1133(-)
MCPWRPAARMGWQPPSLKRVSLPLLPGALPTLYSNCTRLTSPLAASSGSETARTCASTPRTETLVGSESITKVSRSFSSASWASASFLVSLKSLSLKVSAKFGVVKYRVGTNSGQPRTGAKGRAPTPMFSSVASALMARKENGPLLWPSRCWCSSPLRLQPCTPRCSLSSQNSATLLYSRQAMHSAVNSWQHLSCVLAVLQPGTLTFASSLQNASLDLPSWQERHSAVASPQQAFSGGVSQPTTCALAGLLQYSSTEMWSMHARQLAVYALQHARGQPNSSRTPAGSVVLSCAKSARREPCLFHERKGTLMVPSRRDGISVAGKRTPGTAAVFWCSGSKSSATKRRPVPLWLGTKRGQDCD